MRLATYLGVGGLSFVVAVVTIATTLVLPVLVIFITPCILVGLLFYAITKLGIKAFRMERRLRVAIVEDDPDVADLLMKILKAHGIFSRWIGDVNGPSNALEKFGADFVIMDWRLGNGITARDILPNIIHGGVEGRKSAPLKVITYSAVSEKEAQLPSSPDLQHVAHWKKQIGLHELDKKISDLCVA